MAPGINWTIIAKMAGVEIDEKFKIEVSEDIRQFLGDYGIEDEFYNTEFRINDNGLTCYYYTFDDYEDVFISVIVGGILNGLITIKHKKYKPEDGDVYYYVDMDNKSYRIIDTDYLSDNYFDIMNYVNGNCFKTREEALNAAENIYKEFKDKIDNANKGLYI